MRKQANNRFNKITLEQGPRSSPISSTSHSLPVVIPSRSSSADQTESRLAQYIETPPASPATSSPTATTFQRGKSPKAIRPPKPLPPIPLDLPARSTSKNAMATSPVPPTRHHSRKGASAPQRALVWSGASYDEKALFLFTDLLLVADRIQDSFTLERIIPLGGCIVSSNGAGLDIGLDDGDRIIYKMNVEQAQRAYNMVQLLQEVGSASSFIGDCREICELVQGEVFGRQELEDWCKDL